jgi:hypothetical protein
MKKEWFSRGAVAIAGVAVLTACGSPAVTHAGHDIADAGKFLSTLDAAFRNDATAGDEPANLHAQARCYLATSGEDHDISAHAFCGPVLHQFGDVNKPWDSYRITFGGTSDSPTLHASGHATVGVQLPSGSTLVRTDGKTPPSGRDGLTVPPPPALDPGAAMTLDEETGDKLTPITDGRLIGYSYSFQERGVARLNVVGRDREQRRAADGQKLLLIRYDYAAPEGSDTDPVLATLVVDGARTTLNDVVKPGDGQLLVVSVPATAAKVQLELADAGVEQHLDLATGQRESDAAAVLYRKGQSLQAQDDGSGVSVAVNKEFSLPFRRGDIFDGKYPTTLTVNKMDLKYWVSSDLHASAPDLGLLQFDVQTSGGNSWHGPVDPNRVVLVGDDGVTYKAKTDNTWDNINLMNNRYWFEVPATFTGGTVTITPGIVHQTSAGFFSGVDLDYKTSRAQFAIHLP